MSPDAGGSRLKTPWYVALAFHAALLLMIVGVLLHVTTLATNDYTRILIGAVSCAVVSSRVLLLAATRMPRPGRVCALAVGIVDVWVIWGAGAERLLGW